MKIDDKEKCGLFIYLFYLEKNYTRCRILPNNWAGLIGMHFIKHNPEIMNN